MPLSMRRQAAIRKRRSEEREDQVARRQKALFLLTCGGKFTLRSIERSTGVSKSTVKRMSDFVKAGDEKQLSKLLSTSNRPGRCTVLTIDEEQMIVNRLIYAAARGFAIDKEGLKHIMSRVAADGREGFKNGVPCEDVIRSFRARHRELTYKKAENKEQAKLKAQTFEHVQRFFDILTNVVNKEHPGLLRDPSLIWNMDETAVDATEGKPIKVYSSAGTKHGGFRKCSTLNGPSKHITAVIVASPAGLRAPPYLIVAAKNVMSNWLEPVTGKFTSAIQSKFLKYTRHGWFPRDGVVKTTENGSMESAILPSFIKHVDNYVRRHIASDKTYLLTLDGHSSRKGTEWIDECIERKCEAVISPANTSHFLQPCDQSINQVFSSAVKEMHDAFMSFGWVDTKSVNFNIACAVYAFESISAADITSSFAATGIYPFDKSFPQQFKTQEEYMCGLAEQRAKDLQQGSIAGRLNSSVQRKSDAQTVRDALELLNTDAPSERKLQQLGIMLKNRDTVNSILLEAGTGKSASSNVSTKPAKNVPLDAGAPAECVTMGDALERRRRKEAEELHEQVEKEREKLRKQREKTERIEAEKLRQAKRVEDRIRREAERAEKIARKVADKARKEEDRARKRQQREEAIAAERSRRLEEAASRKAAVEEAKAQAKWIKSHARAIAAEALAADKTARKKGSRKQRKSEEQRNGRSPSVRAYNFAATLALEVVASIAKQ